MNMIYERNLQKMKLTILEGTRQNQAVISLASRLGITRQQMRKILINCCDMATLENIGPRLEAADTVASGDYVSRTLSLPHLTTATCLLSIAAAVEFRRRADSGTPVTELLAEIIEVIT